MFRPTTEVKVYLHAIVFCQATIALLVNTSECKERFHEISSILFSLYIWNVWLLGS